jgi:hypothetical protein
MRRFARRRKRGRPYARLETRNSTISVNLGFSTEERSPGIAVCCHLFERTATSAVLSNEFGLLGTLHSDVLSATQEGHLDGRGSCINNGFVNQVFEVQLGR